MRLPQAEKQGWCGHRGWNRNLVDVEVEKYFADYQQNINDNTIYPEPMAQFDFNAADVLTNSVGNAYNIQTGTVAENAFHQHYRGA